MIWLHTIVLHSYMTAQHLPTSCNFAVQHTGETLFIAHSLSQILSAAVSLSTFQALMVPLLLISS